MKLFQNDFYVILQEKETKIARIVAEKRVKENLDRQVNESEEKLRQTHWPGALSELAVALYYNREWEGVYYEGNEWEKRGNDVKDLEVKSSFKWNNLCLDYNDPEMFPDIPFIFVRLFKLPSPGSIRAEFRGWIYGKEAPQLGDLRTNMSGKRYWLVDRSKFRKMDTLPIQT